MSSNESEKFKPDNVKGTWMGEWKWEAKISFIAMIVCFLIAVWKQWLVRDSYGGFVNLISDGAFHSSLLFGCWFYLSDLRYRLCKDVRND